MILLNFRDRVPDGVFLVYSITDRQSFENLPNIYKNIIITYQEDFVSLPNTRLALIGNKSDREAETG